MKLRKNQSLSSFRKLIWDEMSRYVRQKHADWRGYVRCYTCGKIMKWGESDCGHLRHINALDFNLDNLRVQCFSCNRMRSGRGDIFALKLVKEIGLKRVNALYKINVHQFTFTELKKIRERIKKLIKEL